MLKILLRIKKNKGFFIENKVCSENNEVLLNSV